MPARQQVTPRSSSPRPARPGAPWPLPNPTRRIGEPDDIAGTALYLVSNGGSYATGQEITIAGGEVVLAATDNP